MIFIQSRENKHIKQIKKLKDRKYRDQTGLFFIEGQRSLSEALQKPELILDVFIQSDFADHYDSFVNTYPHINWFKLDRKLIEYISDTDTPQGTAAILKKPVWKLENFLPQNGFMVYLDQISDPGNLGTIIRSCWALEVDALLLSPDCADIFNPKTVRASMGGVLDYPVLADIDIHQLMQLKAEKYELVCTDLAKGQDYFKHDFSKRSVLVIGNEAKGVSEKIKKICTDYIKIPMNSRVESLNAASACAIIVAEVWKQRFGSLKLN